MRHSFICYLFYGTAHFNRLLRWRQSPLFCMSKGKVGYAACYEPSGRLGLFKIDVGIWNNLFQSVIRRGDSFGQRFELAVLNNHKSTCLKIIFYLSNVTRLTSFRKCDRYYRTQWERDASIEWPLLDLLSSFRFCVYFHVYTELHRKAFHRFLWSACAWMQTFIHHIQQRVMLEDWSFFLRDFLFTSLICI